MGNDSSSTKSYNSQASTKITKSNKSLLDNATIPQFLLSTMTINQSKPMNVQNTFLPSQVSTRFA